MLDKLKEWGFWIITLGGLVTLVISFLSDKYWQAKINKILKMIDSLDEKTKPHEEAANQAEESANKDFKSSEESYKKYKDQLDSEDEDYEDDVEAINADHDALVKKAAKAQKDKNKEALQEVHNELSSRLRNI